MISSNSKGRLPTAIKRRGISVRRRQVARRGDIGSVSMSPFLLIQSRWLMQGTARPFKGDVTNISIGRRIRLKSRMSWQRQV